jgi:hypothetical protein
MEYGRGTPQATATGKPAIAPMGHSANRRAWTEAKMTCLDYLIKNHAVAEST